jgi:carboxymethylenebutenolidase
MSSSGPPDLAATWDAHTAAEFEQRDADAAVALMTEDTTLVHVPLGIGGVGRDAVREFYARFLTAQVPDDIGMDVLTRTVGDDRVIDEFVVHFTHTVQMDWWAPGVPPTGRAVSVPHIGVIAFRDGLICSEHIYWDQATALVQIGVLDPGDLPMLGAEQPVRFTAPAPSFAPPSPSG